MSFYSDKGDLAVEFFRGPGAKYYGEFNELKEELKKRSPVYLELYQRDINRSMSDGY